MKCPECSNTQKAREGKTCTRCGYKHVLTKKDDSITDAQFKAILRSVSAGDTQYFTFDQLYARYCRGRSSLVAAVVETVVLGLGRFGLVVMVISAMIALFGFVTSSGLWIFIGLGSFLLGVVLNRSGREYIEREPSHRAPASSGLLHSYVRRWEDAGRGIPLLLRSPSLGTPPSGYREADLFDYGVERIIIVERDILVDLFVKNGVHAEQKALVIAESGYPRYLLPHAERILEQRPDLPIVLLHDSTAHGVGMAERLRKSTLLPLGERKFIDAGLYPKQVKGIKSLDAVVPESTGYAVAVDMLPFAVMVTGLAAVASLPMYGHNLVQQVPHDNSDTTSSGGSGDVGVADFGSDGEGGDGDFG